MNMSQETRVAYLCWILACVGGLLCGVTLGLQAFAQVPNAPPSINTYPLQYQPLRQDQPTDIRPVPDPTSLTTAQLYRELASLRAIIETRLDGTDKALLLIQRIADRIPMEIDTRVGQLQSLHAEKFRSIENQFASSKTALDSALQSSEKSNAEKNALQALAISKAETSVAEQLKVISGGISNVERILSDKISGQKERLDRIEGQNAGIGASWIALLGGLGLLLSFVAVIMSIQARAHIKA